MQLQVDIEGTSSGKYLLDKVCQTQIPAVLAFPSVQNGQVIYQSVDRVVLEACFQSHQGPQQGICFFQVDWPDVIGCLVI